LDNDTYLLYQRLRTPTSILRESTSIAVFFGILNILFAISWSLTWSNFDRHGFWLKTCADVLVINSIILLFWLLLIIGIAISRLHRYSLSVPHFTKEIYILSIPYIWLLALNIIVLILTLLSIKNKEVSLWYVLLAIIFLSPIINYLPPLTEFTKDFISLIKKFSQNFRVGLPVMLGPTYNDLSSGNLFGYYNAVINFQYNYINLLPKTLQPQQDEIHHAEYYNATTLSCFQHTLSCLFETSAYLGKIVDKAFNKESWSMIDIGGGEGTFTKELISQCKTLPQNIFLVEPSAKNIENYINLINPKFPQISLHTEVAFIQNYLHKLPKAELILASHSLYSIMDLNEGDASNVIHQLTEKIKSTKGFLIINMASRESIAYKVKSRVLDLVKQKDLSSFGEDMLNILPNGLGKRRINFDTIIDVTPLLNSDEILLGWLSYFCRLPENILIPYVDEVRKIVNDFSQEFKALPRNFRMKYTTDFKREFGLNDTSKILLHKECIIQIHKGRTAYLTEVN
jgi:hypothetical protein